MEASRTMKAAKNAGVALGCQLLAMAFSFVARTFFVYILGSEYLGVKGLFSNILTILSFAELGIGNAIVFSMYRPLATGDRDKLTALLGLYARAYRIIGLVIAAAGLAVIPLLGVLIREAPQIRESLTTIYLFFLADTVASYFFAHKKAVITADQRGYIVTLYQSAAQIAVHVLQCAVLYVTRQFLFTLAIQLAFTLLSNAALAVRADRLYPDLRDTRGKKLTAAETRGIFRNVRALLLYRLGSAVLNGTDSILIAALFGLTAVGVSANYLLVTATAVVLLGKVLEAFTAGVGNLNALEGAERKRRVFDELFFIAAWAYGFAAVGMLLTINDFIRLWLGEAYVLPLGVVFAILLHFYVNGVQFAAYTYRTTLGLFVQGRAAPVAAAVINIVASVLLARRLGLMGIFLGTSLARLCTTALVDPILVYGRCFGRSPVPYFLKYAGFMGLFGLFYVLIGLVLRWIPGTSWPGLFSRILVVTALFNGLMILIFGRTALVQRLAGRVQHAWNALRRQGGTHL